MVKTLAGRFTFTFLSIRHFAGAIVLLSLLAFHAHALPKKSPTKGHRRPASVVKAPARKPASNAGKKASGTIVHAKESSGEHLHPRYQSIDFGGRTYQYYEKTNAFGAVISQFLIGKDRTEIINDPNGDGTIDSWDIFTSSGKMMFSFPYKGRLQFLDIEVMTRQGLMRYSYYWEPVRQTYALFKQKGRPYKSFAKGTELIVGCRGDADELDLENIAKKLDTALDNGSLESELRTNLREQTLQPSCRTGKFASQADTLVNGMMKIAKSDKKDWSNPSAAPKEQGQFLQCMRFYKLDVHASRMEAAFAQYTSLVPKWNFLWKVSCEPPNDIDWGRFVEGAALSEPPTIQVFLDGDGMKEFTGKSNPSKTDQENAYARLVFHEMLHYSQMNENDATTVENCCGTNENNQDACQELKGLTETGRVKQMFENQIVGRLGKDGYGSLLDVIRRSWPDSEAGEQTFDKGLSDLAQEYNSFARDPKCKGTSENSLGSCGDQFKKNALKNIQEAYDPADGSGCRRETDQKLGSAEEGRKTCLLIREILTSVVASGTKSDALNQLCPAVIKSRKTAPATAMNTLLELIDLAYGRLTLANADTKTSTGGSNLAALCKISDNINTGTLDVDYRPLDIDVTAPKSSHSIGTEDTSGATTGSNNSAIVKAPSRGKTTVEYTGPSRPYFTNDSPSRTNAIVNHIQNTENTISNFQSLAEKSFNILVPQAQASSEAWQKKKVETDSTYKKTDFRDGYALQPNGPKTINNPVGSFGKDGSGGAPVPSSRAPASVAPIGAARESGAKLNAGSGGNAGGANGSGPALQGPAAKTASNADGDAPSLRAPRKLSPSEERALEALKTFLQRDDFAKVKKDLDRPSVEASLLDHGVQVVDDTGRTYGSGFPEYRFIYDSGKAKLVPDHLPARSPAKHGR